MNRRMFLTSAATGAGWLCLTGHSPYRQWIVYRETHLVILTSRDDPGADDLGEKLATLVRQALPDSKAVVGRGPRVQRIASLIATRQAEVGVVSRGNALAMSSGAGPFEEIGPIDLRVVVRNEDYLLVCRSDFPRPHGYLVAEALMASGDHDLGLMIPRADQAGIPAHAGALAFAEGQPLDPGGAK
jgi:hypothetical protein